MPCRFILQLRDGRVIAMEADRTVNANVAEHRYSLAAFAPLIINH
jgi:hypothetical protein